MQRARIHTHPAAPTLQPTAKPSVGPFDRPGPPQNDAAYSSCGLVIRWNLIHALCQWNYLLVLA